VGDCGGLNDIPGVTRNGKQKPPDWLAKLLGVQERAKSVVDLEQLLGPRERGE
jgi:hypothetical protein